ncbi:high-affinity iron permease [Tulasnella sp. 417]|nr:high-affinity iron permease [Tulasnella sp. 417]
MSLTVLDIDNSKAKWKLGGNEKREISGGKWALFLPPFVTVEREGLEAVVFIDVVTLGQKATAMPLAAIVGLFCGLIVGFIIYKSSSCKSISIFPVLSNNILLPFGAGPFSKAIGNFQRHKFNQMVGADVAEASNGPGKDKYGNGGWAIFAAIFDWSNDGSVGTILGYVFYWIAVVVALVIMQVTESQNLIRPHLRRARSTGQSETWRLVERMLHSYRTVLKIQASNVVVLEMMNETCSEGEVKQVDDGDEDESGDYQDGGHDEMEDVVQGKGKTIEDSEGEHSSNEGLRATTGPDDVQTRPGG